jgi:cobalt-zinc-cadmium efflux system protein
MHSHHSHNGGHGFHYHGHHHGHHHDHHHEGQREGNKKGLLYALLITSGIMLLEFAGGLVTGSLALLSDSGHMLSDAAALLLSLAAIYLSARPASPRRSFGFHRFEILAALFNGLALAVIAGFIIWEAIRRFYAPPEVESGAMMLIASAGLLANLASAWMLMRKGDVRNNLNLRSAFLHVIGDALGSIGAMAAGVLMLAYDWYIADPIISVLVSLLILRSAWGLMQRTIHILMEGTPEGVDHDLLKQTLLNIEGVKDVHELHIWTITSGFDSLSCHLRIHDGHDSQKILQRAIRILEEQFHIRHAAIQVEAPHIQHHEVC